MKTSAQNRDTQFELLNVRQRANGWTLRCVERGIASQVPDLDVSDDALTQAEHDVVIAAFTILEEKAAVVHRRYVSDPQRLRDLLVEAKAAEEAKGKAEEARAKADAERADLEAAASRAASKCVAAMAEKERLAAELAALDAALAAKRAEAEAAK